MPAFLLELKMLRTIIFKAVFLISHSLFTFNICPKTLQSLDHFENLLANDIENVATDNRNCTSCLHKIKIIDPSICI